MKRVIAKILFALLILILLFFLPKAYLDGHKRGYAMIRPKTIILFGKGETNSFFDVDNILVRMPHGRSLEISVDNVISEDSIRIRMVTPQNVDNEFVRIGTFRTLDGGLTVGLYSDDKIKE
jgi:hypothetical protein